MKDLLKYAAVTALVVAAVLAAIALVAGLGLFVRTATGHQDVYHLEAAYRHFAHGEPAPAPAECPCRKEGCPCVEGGRCACLPQTGCSCGSGCQCDPCPAEGSKRP